MSDLHLTHSQEQFIEGYAQALQDLLYKCTGENHCAKSYDPLTIDGRTIHSYAFDMKDGGRHHPLSDYDSVDDICKTLLNEVASVIVLRFR